MIILIKSLPNCSDVKQCSANIYWLDKSLSSDRLQAHCSGDLKINCVHQIRYCKSASHFY